MTDGIEVHQTLHGYKDGHQLLASSIDLTRDQKWQMLVMSDLSGPTSRSGYESYITGYPLKGGGFYCFAKTWYASELPRPGCVWTHTFLISDTNLAQIENFQLLAEQFQRPDNVFASDQYLTALSLIPGQSICGGALDSIICQNLIKIFYGGYGHPITLISADSKTYESYILALHNQQWPRLRRSFRFCTGALGARDIVFDFAISPADISKKAARENPNMQLGLITTTDQENAFQEDWIKLAGADLTNPDQDRAFRQFLWKFGSDFENGRKAYHSLAEFFAASVISTEKVRDLLFILNTNFPSPEEAARLKVEYFGPNGSLEKGFSTPFEILDHLLWNLASRCLPTDVAAISERAVRLIKYDWEKAHLLAEKSTKTINSNSDAYLDIFANESVKHEVEISRFSIELLQVLINRNPAILARTGAWKRSMSDILDICTILPTLNWKGELPQMVSAAALQAGVWQAVPTLVATFGNIAVFSILEWIDEHQLDFSELPQDIMVALAQNQDHAIEAIQKKKLQAFSLIILTQILNPLSDRLIKMGPEIWMPIPDSLGITGSMPQRTSAFLLSIGFSRPNTAGTNFVRSTFSDIYEAARLNTLMQDNWDLIEPHLPWTLFNWDKCARLIRGIVHLFIENELAFADFVHSFRTEEEFDRALRVAPFERNGLAYLNQAYLFFVENEVPLPGGRLKKLALASEEFWGSSWI